MNAFEALYEASRHAVIIHNEKCAAVCYSENTNLQVCDMRDWRK